VTMNRVAAKQDRDTRWADGANDIFNVTKPTSHAAPTRATVIFSDQLQIVCRRD
jgi:hypothetical protein